MKRILAALAILAVSLEAGCHAQVPPATTQTVNLTWTASTDAGCTTNCAITYAVYRCTNVANCTDLSSTQWTEITNPASRPSATNFTDSTPPTGTIEYVVEGVAGNVNSGPSNIAQVNVTAISVPTAPALNTPAAQSALLDRQSLPQSADKQMAANVTLVARLDR